MLFFALSFFFLKRYGSNCAAGGFVTVVARRFSLETAVFFLRERKNGVVLSFIIIASLATTSSLVRLILPCSNTATIRCYIVNFLERKKYYNKKKKRKETKPAASFEKNRFLNHQQYQRYYDGGRDQSR